MFRNSRVISFRFDGRTQWQTLSVTLRPPCWCPSTWAPTWRLQTKLCKFGWNTFPNNARMNYRTVLNLGEVVYISIIFHILVSWLNLLNGYDFYFWWGDTANHPLSIFSWFSYTVPRNRFLILLCSYFVLALLSHRLIAWPVCYLKHKSW